MEFIKQDNKIICKQQEIEVGYCQLVKHSDQVYNLTFVYVNPEFRGQGIAALLVEKAVEDATVNNYKIRPVCPYAVHEFAKHYEYKKVLPKR